MKINRELMKSALQKQDNPFAICTASVGRENKDKYERCVMHLKDKLGIKKDLEEKDWNAEHENMNADLMSTSEQNYSTERPDLTDDTTAADMFDTRRLVDRK